MNMDRFTELSTSSISGRRHFLATNALGIGSVALAWLLNEDKLLAALNGPNWSPRRSTCCLKSRSSSRARGR